MSTPSTRYKSEADDSAGPAKKVVIPTDGDAQVIEEISGGVDLHGLTKDLAFLEERVKVLVYPVNDGQSVSRLVSVGVNGEKMYLIAGKPKWVKRKHIAQLIKARPDVIYHTSDDPSAERMNIMTRQSTSKYNFEVLEDTPRGQAWLNHYRQIWQKR